MRLARRATLLVAFSLLTSAATAYAECACEYTYRRAGRGEYHVACWSASGTPTYYIVFTVTGNVMGPYSN